MGASGISWGEALKAALTSLPMFCGQSSVPSSVNRKWGGCEAPSPGLDVGELSSHVDSDYDPRQAPDLLCASVSLPLTSH